ncbi:hypothetical protein [Microbacterium oleivorans]|uniref:Uncharacterized protein n=1 Tax=Microbacterium oleivorans TaxID=273677 RepID=A0A7D5IPJ7_9MICO|nr:hypothetical protein [Microbacterium oleivorans]QLD10881.1 hypothetical protein HW566_03235 [Microbacterium oleivorans]
MILPATWQRKLAHLYVPEMFAVILGLGSGIFGASILAMPSSYRSIPSFAQAFVFVAPHWWGMVMVVLGVAMLSLLTHSRAAAAVPTFLLAIVWVLWVVPIALSPGFAPSAPIVYGMISVLTLAAGLACLVPREEKP